MRFPRLLVAVAVAATACSDSQSPVAPRWAASTAVRARASGLANESKAEYQLVDVGVAVDAGAARVDINPGMLNSAGMLIARTTDSQFGWTATDGILNILASNGLTIQPDANDDRGDLVGFTGPGNGSAFWYRPAGGSFQQIPAPANAGLFYDQRMNQNGEVVGGYLANQANCTLWLYSPMTGRTDVYTSGPGHLLIPLGFNDARQVVGEDEHLPAGPTFAFTWSAANGFSESPEPSGYFDINDAGVRVFREGTALSGAGWLIYPDGNRVPLPTPFGDPRVTGANINDDGFAIGSAFDPARGGFIPLVWSPDLGVILELPGLTASNIGWGQSINLYGDAAGTSLAPDGTYHVVFWKHAATIAGLEAATARYVIKPGVVNALNAKLDEAAAAIEASNEKAKTGALTAYRNLLSAQSGKSVATIEANLLVRLSERL